MTGTSLGLSEISTIQTVLVLWGRDSVVGLSTEVWPLCQLGQQEIHFKKCSWKPGLGRCSRPGKREERPLKTHDA